LDAIRKIKQCADAYARRLGINYERAAGVLNRHVGGFTIFGYVAAFSSLGVGYVNAVSRTIIAHELGHTYNLCDEYDLNLFYAEHLYLGSLGLGGCQNSYTTVCTRGNLAPYSRYCVGTSPVHKAFGGLLAPIGFIPVCQGLIERSVMGTEGTTENCGFDTGGHNAIQ